jgi:hypothetical protein
LQTFIPSATHHRYYDRQPKHAPLGLESTPFLTY